MGKEAYVLTNFCNIFKLPMQCSKFSYLIKYLNRFQNLCLSWKVIILTFDQALKCCQSFVQAEIKLWMSCENQHNLAILLFLNYLKHKIRKTIQITKCNHEWFSVTSYNSPCTAVDCRGSSLRCIRIRGKFNWCRHSGFCKNSLKPSNSLTENFTFIDIIAYYLIINTNGSVVPVWKKDIRTLADFCRIVRQIIVNNIGGLWFFFRKVCQNQK